MRLLLYKDLDTSGVRSAMARLRCAIEAGDWRSADIKKLAPTAYWRAKLDYASRLLLQFARCGDETVCLALEVIENHAYDKSRFLRGAPVDEGKLEREPALAEAPAGPALADGPPLRWLHPQRDDFELLDKPIVFDDAQEAVHRMPAPLILVGSAGSGKTAVLLAKLREARGRVLYVTQSAYLAQSARALYGAHGYENPEQDAEFLSYRAFVETLQVPAGREVHFAAFANWYQRQRPALKGGLGELDAHAVFEEFRGVLAAGAQGPLSLADYLALGERQSLLGSAAREAAHALFGRYRQWLVETKQFDLNLVAYDWRTLAQPAYDFVVVDEVQDLTNVALSLILAICEGVNAADRDAETLEYRRARDKGDKSLEIFKFYVNALYVAVTRAVQTLTVVETDFTHPLLQLLGLEPAAADEGPAVAPASSREEWAREARKLELQGKQEQAQAIREAFLQSKTVPWAPWSEAAIRELLPRAFDRTQPSAKPRQALLDYALWHGQQRWVEQLSVQANFRAARSLAPAGDFGGPLSGEYDGDWQRRSTDCPSTCGAARGASAPT